MTDPEGEEAEVSTQAKDVEDVEAWSGSESNRFDLPGQADIRVAAEIKDQCREALDGTGDVRVDCGAVERVDAAVLQCLGSLARSLADSSRALKLVERTEAFDRAVDLLGFEELLAGT